MRIRSTITRVGPKHQVTIPQEVFRDAGLQIGDYLELQAYDNRITMIPKKLIAKDDAWFHTPEWQAKEKQADDAIAKGQISGPFLSAKDALAHLNKRKTRRA